VASTTIDLLSRVWNAPSQAERDRLRRKAEEHAADNGGPKMIQVGLALDRLVDTVADVAKDMRDEGTKAIQSTSVMLVGGSFFIALLNLFLTRPRAPRQNESGPVIRICSATPCLSGPPAISSAPRKASSDQNLLQHGCCPASDHVGRLGKVPSFPLASALSNAPPAIRQGSDA
jgi:hypothetical protein